MRAGVCTVQQALTAEAAAVVKQAVSLARRRGNAQVTPLHVASAMLQASAGLLRAACLRSHSHPLQCKALELCFNVALNRLPAGSPLHGHVYYPPSLSNALVAAFKRAQAHQRRGSVDTQQQQQQQPVLAVKIELEQLVISILDDPSVSRVMREAGFSSPQVKANVEHAVVSCIEGTGLTNPNPSSSSSPPTEENKPAGKLPVEQVREEDVAAILDCLASRSKRRVMVVAESASGAEAAAMAAVDRIKDKAAAPRVISISVSMFRDAPREEAERRLGELRRVVAKDKAAGGRGVVLVVEDLRWAAEFWAGRVGRRASSCYYYCAVEHAVGEVRALACRGDGDGVWLVTYGSYQAYMRCRAGNPSLESLWGIQTLAIPVGSLALSLSCVDVDSAIALSHRQSTSPACLSLLDASGSGQPMAAVSTSCGDCSATNPDAMRPSHRSMPSSSNIPPWLRHCRDQELPHCKKWSSTTWGGGSESHRTTLNFSTVVSPSSSVSSYEQYYHMHQPYQPWIVADPWRAKYSFDDIVAVDEAVEGVKLLSAAVKSKSRDSSASNGGSVEVGCRSRSFKEVSAENLKVLCGALEKEVPWQKEIVPEIASTVLRCRSGMAKRRDAMKAKEETWMLFLGGDTDGKARVARELASLVFGSRRSFVSVDADACSPGRSDSFTEQQHHANNSKKRPLPQASHLERLYEAVRDNPHRVILVEGVERLDRRCQMGIKESIESGVVRRSHSGADDDVASLGDAIIVLCCESFDSRSRACSPPTSKKAKAKKSDDNDDDTSNDHHDNEAASCFDLNMSVDEDQEVVVDECSFGDAGLIKAVDRTLFFRPPEEV